MTPDPQEKEVTLSQHRWHHHRSSISSDKHPTTTTAAAAELALLVLYLSNMRNTTNNTKTTPSAHHRPQPQAAPSSSRYSYPSRLTPASSVASSSLPTFTTRGGNGIGIGAAATSTYKSVTTSAAASRTTAGTTTTVHFDDPDRHHPISYSFLLIMGLLVVLPAVLSYATLEQSLQQQNVCFVGPAPASRNQWTTAEHVQREEFLKPLYGIYHLSPLVTSTTTSSTTTTSTASSTTLTPSKSHHHQPDKNVLQFFQSPIHLPQQRWLQPSVPFMARTFWSVTTMANTLLIGATTPLQQRPTLIELSSLPSSQQQQQQLLPQQQQQHTSASKIQWDQQEMNNSDRARQQASTNNRWCLVPSPALLQIFDITQKQQQQQQQQLQQQLASIKSKQSKSSASASMYGHRNLQEEPEEEEGGEGQLPSSSTSSSTISPPTSSLLTSVNSTTSTATADATTTIMANTTTTKKATTTTKTPLPKAQKPSDTTATATTAATSNNNNNNDNINLVRYQICSKMEPSLLLSHLPPFEWPMKPPPNGIWNQYEVVFPITNNKKNMVGGIKVGGSASTSSAVAAATAVDDDVAMALPYLDPSQQPMQVQVACFSKQMNSMEDVVATRRGSSSTSSNSNRSAKSLREHRSMTQQQQQSSSASNSYSLSSSSSTSDRFIPLAETPVTWLLIIMLIWQQCTYRRRRKRRPRPASSASLSTARSSSVRTVLEPSLPSSVLRSIGEDVDDHSISASTTQSSILPSLPPHVQHQGRRYGWQSRHHHHHHVTESQSVAKHRKSSSRSNSSRQQQQRPGEQPQQAFSRSTASNHQQQQSRQIHSSSSASTSGNSGISGSSFHLVVAMYEQWVHSSWKELVWNVIWLYLVASRLERDYLGGLILLAVYVTLGWMLAMVRVIMVHYSHYLGGGGSGGGTAHRYHAVSPTGAADAGDGDDRTLSSWRRGKSHSKQPAPSMEQPIADDFTEKGQAGILIALVVLLAQQQSSFSLFGLWTFDSFPVINPSSSDDDSFPPSLYLNLLPAIVIAPSVLLIFPTGKDYISLFLGTIIPAMSMGWIMSWNWVIDVLAAPQWTIPVTLLVHLVLLRWSPKLACCYQEHSHDDRRHRHHRRDEPSEDFRPLFLHDYNRHDGRIPSDEQSGEWTLVGGSATSEVQYQKQRKRDDFSIISDASSADEPEYQWHMSWTELLAVGTWMLIGCGLTVLPWFWSIQLDVSLLVGHVAVSLLLMPVLLCGDVDIKRPNASSHSLGALVSHYYHIVAALTLVVVQIMTLSAWNVAHVAMMSAASLSSDKQTHQHPQEEQLLTWWTWSQSVLSHTKFASSLGASGGDDNFVNRMIGSGMNESSNVSFPFATSFLLAEIVIVSQILWHWTSLLVTSYRLKQHQRIAGKSGGGTSSNLPYFGGDSRDVGLWFSLQVMSEEFRIWYRALACR